MFIIFYGPEGSGKSTQAKMLADKLKLPCLGSGELIRKFAKDYFWVVVRRFLENDNKKWI